MRFNCFLLLFLIAGSYLFALSYEVRFVGIHENYILKTIENSSDLVKLQNHPPSSYSGLRYRANSDIAHIKKALDAYGYFDATINFRIKEEPKKLKIIVFIEPGTRYILKSFKLKFTDGKPVFSLKQLGVELGKPTSNIGLADFKQKAKTILGNDAYPLAQIQKFDIVVDKESKVILAEMEIDKGMRCYFGPTIIIGLDKIKPEFVRKKLIYQEGDLFSPAKLVETKQRLMKTELFSSIIIHYPDNSQDPNLPIKIYMGEAKNKTISLGASYATKDHFGGNFTYANHNFRGVGELLALQGYIAQQAQTGTITWSKTDVFAFNQNLFVQAYAEKDWPSLYHAYIYGGYIRLERKISKIFFYSYGIKNEYIDSFHSGNEGKYYVLGIPVFLNYNTSNDLLNPSSGLNFRYYVAVYKNLWGKKNVWLKQKITFRTYVATKKDARIIFAFRFQLGSIFGPSLYQIPITKLFLGGTDDDLRGYRYQTVGPRDRKGDLIGGRSCIFFTFEPRVRLTETIGIVPFLDVGKINTNKVPTVSGRWRKSLGIGGRYFSVMGPIRLDVGFPLDRYSKGDPRFRIYLSLGQAF